LNLAREIEHIWRQPRTQHHRVVDLLGLGEGRARFDDALLQRAAEALLDLLDRRRDLGRGRQDGVDCSCGSLRGSSSGNRVGGDAFL